MRRDNDTDNYQRPDEELPLQILMLGDDCILAPLPNGGASLSMPAFSQFTWRQFIYTHMI